MLLFRPQTISGIVSKFRDSLKTVEFVDYQSFYTCTCGLYLWMDTKQWYLDYCFFNNVLCAFYAKWKFNFTKKDEHFFSGVYFFPISFFIPFFFNSTYQKVWGRCFGLRKSRVFPNQNVTDTFDASLDLVQMTIGDRFDKSPTFGYYARRDVWNCIIIVQNHDHRTTENGGWIERS